MQVQYQDMELELGVGDQVMPARTPPHDKSTIAMLHSDATPPFYLVFLAATTPSPLLKSPADANRPIGLPNVQQLIPTHPHCPSPPWLLIWRQHPGCAHAYAWAHTSPRVSRTIFSPGEWCTLAPPPPLALPCATPAHLWGLCRRPRQSRGSDNGGRQCAGPTRRCQWHSVNIRGQRLQMQTYALEPCMLA